MSGTGFSSRDEDAFERTVDCEVDDVIESAEHEMLAKYQLKKCMDWVTKNKYQKVCLQFPDALLPDSVAVALFLQKTIGQVFYILGDTSYGSCCVDEVAAEHVGADAIIHFGHACLSPTSGLPVLYIFNRKEMSFDHLKSVVNDLSPKGALIFYDVAYEHLYKDICDCFGDNHNIYVSKLQQVELQPDDGFIHLLGRTVKNNINSEEIGIFLGPDSVTLNNLTLALPEMKWYFFDNGNLKEFFLKKSKFLMQRVYLVEKLNEAKVIGILIGTLGITNTLDAVNRISDLSKKKGKKCYILAVGKPNVAKLANFPEIDVFVSVACSENALLKESKEYYKPIVSLFEVEMAFGERSWNSEYSSDFRELLPGGAFFQEAKCDLEHELSLVSNRMSDLLTIEDENKTSCMDLIDRNLGTVVEFSGAEFLSNRSWRGLEQNLDQTGVEKAVAGQSGIAYGYEDEGAMLKKEGT